MNHPAKTRVRRAAAAAAMAVLALGAAGCGAINDQATAQTYDPSDGVSVHDLAGTESRNLMLVTNGATEPSRLIGSVINNGSKATSVSFDVNGKTVSVNVDAGKSVSLQDADLTQQLTFPASGDKGVEKTVAPGLQVKTAVSAGGKEASVNVPVVDGSLTEYAKYVPGGAAKDTTKHLEPSKAAEGGH